MTHLRPLRWIAAAIAALSIALAPQSAGAAENDMAKTSGGLTVYFGVVPAAIVKGPSPHSGERPMHGRIPTGAREYHVVAAVFDATSGARVSDATVTAQVSGLAMAGPRRTLEPMAIAGTTTYGAFFELPGRDRYTVKLTVTRAGSAAPAGFEFRFDNR